MKTFYIRDPQGNYASCDGKVIYRPIKGKQIHEYFKKDANRAKFFVNTSEEGDSDEIWYEVDPTEVSIALRAKRREQYVRDQKRLSGIEEISLDDVCCFTSFGEPIYLIEIVDSYIPSPEEEFMRHCEIEDLYKAVGALKSEDQRLIWELYLRECPLTEQEYANKYGLLRITVNKRKLAALNRLKRMLQNF